MPDKTHTIDIADYDQSGYDYISYWQNRQYEDYAERSALKKLLPRKGNRLVDLGGGFGRLSDLYAPLFDQATLLDYSQDNLDQAQIRLKQLGIKNVKTIQGNLYNLPFSRGEFGVALMVRVIHHLEKPEIALKEVNRVLKDEGVCILEFPNKIHLKARLKACVKGNFSFTSNEQPVQKSTHGGIFYNYHPGYIQRILINSGFTVTRKISVSNFRLDLLKKVAPLPALLGLEGFCQAISSFSLSHFYLGPSIFYLCVKTAAAA